MSPKFQTHCLAVEQRASFSSPSTLILTCFEPYILPFYTSFMIVDPDSAACRQSDTMFIVWMRHLDKYKTYELAARLAFQHLGRQPVDSMHHSQSSFNHCYKVMFREGPDVIVRFPALSRSMFRREKLEDEIAVMEYIRHNASVPIPCVLGSGVSVVGPYMILEYVGGSCYRSISGLLRTRRRRRH